MLEWESGFTILRWRERVHSAAVPCATCVLNMCIFPKLPGFTKLPLKLPRKHLSRNTNRFSCVISPFSEDKGQPLVLIKTKVCVSQRIFTIVNYQKQWGDDDDDNHNNTNISPSVLSIKAEFWGPVLCCFCRHIVRSSCKSSVETSASGKDGVTRAQIYLPNWNKQKLRQNMSNHSFQDSEH